MHEMGLCESLVDRVCAAAEGRAVTSVSIRVGSAHDLDEGAVTTGFALAAEGTLAEGATVDLRLEPGDARCLACGETSHAPSTFPLCPRCGNPDLVPEGEITIESIEYRRPAAADTTVAGDTTAATETRGGA